MIGVASGLALEKKKVFVYSIGNFPTLRCLEQIRNDACYHELNVNIIASGGGFSYGGLGMSHHATEDLSIMRSLPGATVIAPATEYEVRASVMALYQNKGLGYLRLDKSKVDTANEYMGDFSIGKANKLRSGNDFTLIAIGGITEEAIKAADELSKKGIECTVLSMCTLKPIDKESIVDACLNTKGIVTIEENNLMGGLGSAVSEVCLDNNIRPNFFKRIGMKDEYSSIVGDQLFLRSFYGMDSKTIIKSIDKFISRNLI